MISSLIARHKQRHCINNEQERYEILRHSRFVDEVLVDAPWFTTKELLQEHKIDFQAHDDVSYADVNGNDDDPFKVPREMGKFISTKRTVGISTTAVIEKVIQTAK